jgi:disulfide oxidoreductase YuzD
MITQTICKTLKFRIMNSINNVTMTVNNQETVFNNSIVTNMEELTKKLKKEEKVLQHLAKSKADASVITAQEQIVSRLKTQHEEVVAKEEQAKEHIGDSLMTFSVVDDETGARSEIQKKIAFVKHNRPVDNKKVDGFISIIANGKYEKAYPIIVIEAEKVLAKGYEVKNLKGEKLTQEKAKEYFCILDGQHRSKAFAKLNIISGNTYTIPNVHVKEVENIGAYLVDINGVGTSWSQKDRVTVAALTTDDELFTNVAELLDEGFNQSTAMLIFTGKKLSNGQISHALKGEEFTLPKDAKINIERGQRFVTLCKAASIKVQFITKRYFIDGFNSYATATNEETAFEALAKLKDLKLTEERLKEIKGNDDFICLLKEASQAA